MTNDPFFKLYRLLITSRRSDVFFTGKNRLRGTLIPMPPSNDFIAAPTAVSSWITFKPLFSVLLLMIISKLREPSSRTLSIAEITRNLFLKRASQRSTVEFGPQIVRVEKLEGLDRFEGVHVFLWYLGDLEKSQFVFVLDQSATLEMSFVKISRSTGTTG
jgi:hypothetical protein